MTYQLVSRTSEPSTVSSVLVLDSRMSSTTVYQSNLSLGVYAPRRMQSCAPRCGKAGRLLSYWIVSYRGLLGRIPCCSQRPYKLRQVPTYQTCFIGSLGIGLNIRTCFKFFFIRSTPLFPNPLDEAHL